MTKIQIKLREVAKIIYRRKFFNFLKKIPCLVYSQIWLNLRVDDGHFCYITNLTTQPWVNHGQNFAIHPFK
jgi:hypothetical protein